MSKERETSGLAGKTLMPRVIAESCRPHWQNFELTKAIAVALAESAGSIGAWHDNYDGNGDLSSRDCGLFQINIPAVRVGTFVEESLRTESLDEAEWKPVLENNIEAAVRLYNTPMDRWRNRLWQPWVAYTTGWATFPEWWVWAQDSEGRPIGEWHKTGRYIQRAIAGQMNYHIVILQDWTVEQALSYSKRYISKFGIHEGELVEKQDILQWAHIPPMPTAPPADGIGPRPVKNDGR